MSVEQQLKKATELLGEMVCQADEDTPGEYRTKHFRQHMDDCIDFINDHREADKVRVR